MKKIPFGKFSVILFMFAAIAVLLGGAYYFGYTEGVKNPKTILVREAENIAQGKPAAVDFSSFWVVWNAIHEKHLNIDEADTASLISGAIDGMVEALNDPYSVFMSDSEAERFSQDISGEFGGIGAEIGKRDDNIIVVAPLKGTPAERAGLKSKDVILKVDDISTAGMTIEEAVLEIRGERGTTVVLTILREGLKEPMEISIMRDTIQIPTLDFRMLETEETGGKKIAYVQLYNFYEKSFPLFYRAALQIMVLRPDGIILDLRNNPGGYLSSSVNIAGLMLEHGTKVVAEETRSASTNIELKASGPGLLRNIPTVVLVNEGSASAAEILAGALRDQRGAPLVGSATFGKGTVQEVLPIGDSLLKITIARWVLPSGHVIESEGLVPDYEVEMDEDNDIEFGSAEDAQFQKALELIKNL